MEYFLEFHWWYLVVAIVLCFVFFGESKGGIVVKRLCANLEILDDRFKDCRPQAEYSIFKEGKPDHLEIEIERLSIPVGEELEFFLNGKLLADVKVKKNREAEFDHWSDEGVEFPVVNSGDEVVIKYRKSDVLRGTFR